MTFHLTLLTLLSNKIKRTVQNKSRYTISAFIAVKYC